MKSRLANRTGTAATGALVVALTLLVASATRAADNPRPVKPSNGTPPAIDPNTGLPVPPAVWIDPNWQDPDKVLPEVTYDGIPLNVIADQLRQEFKGAFDILIPRGSPDPNNPEGILEPGSATITMQLKNVRASEVFNAMNFILEAENTPYRWELKLNGNRPTAFLRVLPQLLPTAGPPPPMLPKTRMVYFVGDLIDDTKPGGMTMERLVHTVWEVYALAYGDPKNEIRFHKATQLLVVTGTSDQLAFIQQTLSALRGKAQAAKAQLQPGLMPKPEPVEKTAQ